MKRYTFCIPATAKNGRPTKLYPKSFYDGGWINWTNNKDEAITWDDESVMKIVADEFVSPGFVVIGEKNEQDKGLDVSKAPSDSKQRTTLFD